MPFPARIFREAMLETLAQTGTKKSPEKLKRSVIVNGSGSDLTDYKLMQGRGRRKIITQTLVLNLLKVAEKKGNHKMIQSLWNTYYCQTDIQTSSDRGYCNYCKNKFCTVCLANRKAEIINKYLPVLSTWEDPHFVTLTVRSVPAKKLKWIIEKGLVRAMRIIIERNKKRNQRGKGIKLMGVRSLECSFNPQKRTYNPHYHLIVPDKAAAELLVREWLNIWTPEHALRKGQDLRRVEGLGNCLVEIVKYGTKIFMEPDVNKKSKGKTPPATYISALYNIFSALSGHRLFERFGFNLPKTQRRKAGEPKELRQYGEWKYDSIERDWVNIETGETLTKYIPPPDFVSYWFGNVDLANE